VLGDFAVGTFDKKQCHRNSMIKRGLSVFYPPKDLVDACGLTTKLKERENVLWLGTPGWISTFYCAASWQMIALNSGAILAYYKAYWRNVALYQFHGVFDHQLSVIVFVVVLSFYSHLFVIPNVNTLIYIVTTSRIIVKAEWKNRSLTQIFAPLRGIVDPDGFAIYDIGYLNGCSVCSGLFGYGNILAVAMADMGGQLRGELREVENGKRRINTEPIFGRSKRYVKISRRLVLGLGLIGSPSNVYFGIKDVAKVGDLLNQQCDARLGKSL
jgi:hypothetical protein